MTLIKGDNQLISLAGPEKFLLFFAGQTLVAGAGNFIQNHIDFVLIRC